MIRPKKCCPACGEIKPRSAFASNRTTIDGRQSYCRDCASEARRQFRMGERRVPRRCACGKSGASPFHCSCGRWKPARAERCEVCLVLVEHSANGVHAA